jgi:hypothetical protein
LHPLLKETLPLGPDIMSDWMDLVRYAKEKNPRFKTNIELRKKYVYDRVIMRICWTKAAMEPPACVVEGVSKLPPEITWPMLWPDDHYYGNKALREE